MCKTSTETNRERETQRQRKTKRQGQRHRNRDCQLAIIITVCWMKNSNYYDNISYSSFFYTMQLKCNLGPGRTARHALLNDIYWSGLTKETERETQRWRDRYRVRDRHRVRDRLRERFKFVGGFPLNLVVFTKKLGIKFRVGWVSTGQPPIYAHTDVNTEYPADTR